VSIGGVCSGVARRWFSPFMDAEFVVATEETYRVEHYRLTPKLLDIFRFLLGEAHSATGPLKRANV
jgi:hypothetical protein